MKKIAFQALLDLQQMTILAEWGDYEALEKMIEIDRSNIGMLCQLIAETTKHFGYSIYAGYIHSMLSVRGSYDPQRALVIVWERSGGMEEVSRAAQSLQAAMGGWKRG